MRMHRLIAPFGSIFRCRAAGPEFQIIAENVPVAGSIGDRCELCEHAAPDSVPAVYPDVLPGIAGIADDTLHIAGIRMRRCLTGMCLRIVVAVAGKRHGLINSDDIHDILVVSFLLLGLILSNSRVVKPDSSPCQLIIVIAGSIKTKHLDKNDIE